MFPLDARIRRLQGMRPSQSAERLFPLIDTGKIQGYRMGRITQIGSREELMFRNMAPILSERLRRMEMSSSAMTALEQHRSMHTALLTGRLKPRWQVLYSPQEDGRVPKKISNNAANYGQTLSYLLHRSDILIL